MDQTLSGLCAASLELFETARAAGEYEIAYHALVAVLHAGERLVDPDTCRLVERLANECREAIDANGGRHRLSTAAAASRGNESVFKQLAVMAVSARLRMEAEQKLKGRPKAPFADSKS